MQYYYYSMVSTNTSKIMWTKIKIIFGIAFRNASWIKIKNY